MLHFFIPIQKFCQKNLVDSPNLIKSTSLIISQLLSNIIFNVKLSSAFFYQHFQTTIINNSKQNKFYQKGQNQQTLTSYLYLLINFKNFLKFGLKNFINLLFVNIQIVVIVSTNMTSLKNTDYMGIKPYKFIALTILLISIFISLVGPFLFSFSYQIFCFSILGFSFFRTLLMKIQCSIALIRSLNLIKKIKMKKIQKKQDKKKVQVQEIYHAIIIPNYKESIQLLIQTLGTFAAHQKAKSNYLIFLAMEGFQEGSDQKGEILVRNFKNSFKFINYTVHQLQKHEDRMKSSNSNWALEHMKEMLDSTIPMERIIVTSIDADSCLHETYFDQIEEYIIANPQNRQKAIFCSPQIFLKNQDIPNICKVAEDLYCIVIFHNLTSLWYTMPMSNYSLSYKLVEDIGFLDTCKEAIGEDLHIITKSHWKKNGDIVTVPIFVPSVQRSIQTGNGFIADIKAKFWQMERHGQACAEVAYCTKMLVEKKNRTIKDFILNLIVLEMILVPMLTCLISISLIIFTMLSNQSQQLFNGFTIQLVLNLIALLQSTSQILYFIFKNKTGAFYFNSPPQSITRLIINLVLTSIVFIVYMTPAFVIPVFTVALVSKFNYHLSEKRVEKLNSINLIEANQEFTKKQD